MAIIKKYPSLVVALNSFAKGVYTIELASLDKPFRYEPGQFLHLAVDEYDPAGQWPDSRCFSIQSAPSEKNIRITYSVKGRYTHKMQQTLKYGSKVWLKLPYGDLFSHVQNKERAVFLAGGTGLTPFLSLFNDPSFIEYKDPFLFAGFKDRTMNFYHKEIERAKDINPTLFLNFKYEVEDGFIDLNEVIKISGKKSTYYISGPPSMIKSFKETLISKGIPTSQILTDDWG